MPGENTAEVMAAARAERAARLREEAVDAAAYRKALEEEGFSAAEALELVQFWQGMRWDEGAP